MLEEIIVKHLGSIKPEIQRAIEVAKEMLGEGSHGLSHTERVLKLALEIGKKEGADLEVLALAAILHDVARPLEEKGLIKDHAKESAKIARDILNNYPKIEEVVHAIEAHRFSRGVEPRTLEAKILSDADKIDALGAVGIARVFMYSGEHGRSIEDSIRHFEEKILKLKDLMYTKTGKKIAEERHKIVEDFLEELKKEITLF
ncbi:HD domain-containing protein [Pyrococcus sp. ST04]|uniref:HD domain-containing protein n=1 Tax=Pyrococcus sp. ST04 TaxID=1183377 RepID=UPI0002605A2E|nr:HD domain-containing protein [Pyrococcus sp. ST04]AFK21983.1 putative metal-dependent phosphohydrolase, HD superfamily [Pyrococcus sp. ST04]